MCLKLARSLRKPEIKVTRYFPRQFNARAKALGNIAYNFRKADPPLKTSIEYTNDDVILLTSPRGQYIYTLHNVEDLPPVDFTPLRSPPTGRSNKRNRSNSHSPLVENKKDRIRSPTNINQESICLLETLNNNSSIQTGTSEASCLNPIKDIGLFSGVEASSPTTGRVFFDLSDNPSISRRMSLNF